MIIDVDPNLLMQASNGASPDSSYLVDRWNSALQHIQQLPTQISEYGSTLINQSKEMYQKAADSDYLRALKASLRNTQDVDYYSRTSYISDYLGMQTANIVMQGYILAAPALQPYVLSGAVDNWDDQNPPPIDNTRIWEDQKIVKQVINGMSLTTDTYMVGKRIVHEEVIIHYDDDEIEEMKSLEIYEQADIIDTWDTVKMLVDSGFDPTSPLGNKL